MSNNGTAVLDRVDDTVKTYRDAIKEHGETVFIEDEIPKDAYATIPVVLAFSLALGYLSTSEATKIAEFSKFGDFEEFQTQDLEIRLAVSGITRVLAKKLLNP